MLNSLLVIRYDSVIVIMFMLVETHRFLGSRQIQLTRNRHMDQPYLLFNPVVVNFLFHYVSTYIFFVKVAQHSCFGYFLEMEYVYPSTLEIFM